ncbi:MAG: hypothetical protein HFF13_06470 [Angelakisella sp.]|jgi:hypothetical protein|nr:hypothetical protein [Angelakisella sp.]
MTDLELRKRAAEIASQLRDETIPDEEILRQIREEPGLVHATCLSGANLFLEAVVDNRFPLAQALHEMGTDIHWTYKASVFNGNALNVARTPQQAEQLLAWGIEIEKNLSLHISKPFKNPAIMAAFHNDTTMLLYWLRKQRELFADTPEYVGEIFYGAIDVVSMMNQYNMLSCVIANEELFGILKEIYAQVDDTTSIRLYLSALRHISDEALEPRKKELRKILNAKKRELSAMA